MVCKPLKAFYDLKQSPKLCYKRLSNFLFLKLGLVKINADYSIFITPADLNKSMISTFIYEIKIMVSKSSDIIAQVKSKLATAFSMVDIFGVKNRV